MIDYIVKSRSMKDIRDVVNEFKKKFNLYDCLRCPLVYIFEQIIPLMFPDYRFLYVEDCELEGVEAYTDHNLKEVKIRKSVYLKAIEGSCKDLFTIAHEIGHLFLHDGEAMVFARTKERFPSYKSAEWQANYFAAELLMGSHLILNLSVEQISYECNVSEKSARIQLEHTISEREKGRL